MIFWNVVTFIYLCLKQQQLLQQIAQFVFLLRVVFCASFAFSLLTSISWHTAGVDDCNIGFIVLRRCFFLGGHGEGEGGWWGSGEVWLGVFTTCWWVWGWCVEVVGFVGMLCRWESIRFSIILQSDEAPLDVVERGLAGVVLLVLGYFSWSMLRVECVGLECCCFSEVEGYWLGGNGVWAAWEGEADWWLELLLVCWWEVSSCCLSWSLLDGVSAYLKAM